MYVKTPSVRYDKQMKISLIENQFLMVILKTMKNDQNNIGLILCKACINCNCVLRLYLQFYTVSSQQMF